jgi:hypothetical protein
VVAHSDNGWQVVTGGLTTIEVGPARMSVLAGPVAVVLEYVADRFHHEVETLIASQCGGYNHRKISGSDVWSNHASGTAIDLNWGRHPMGASGTFTGAQHSRIDKILADCDGVVVWGGHYNGTKDEMHFDIDKGTAAVRALALKISTPPPPEVAPVTTIGFEGSFTINQAWADHLGGTVGGTTTYGVALRQAALLAEEARTNTNNIQLGLSQIAASIQAINSDLQTLTRDPADMDNPETHPIIQCLRYVEAHPL